MKTTTQNFLKWSATAAGMTGVAAMSAYVMTSYLVKMAMDREEPKLMKAIERKKYYQPAIRIIELRPIRLLAGSMDSDMGEHSSGSRSFVFEDEE